MNHRRRALQVILILVVMAFALAAVRLAFRPPMPKEWSYLMKGVNRDRVLGTAVQEHTDMRALKGYDAFTQESTMLGGSCYWQLKTRYDQAGLLTNAEAQFVYRPFGLFSRSPMTVFRQR